MKIVHPHIDKQIDFDKSDVYILIIENPQEFYNLSKQIISQFNGEEGEWIRMRLGKWILPTEGMLSAASFP